MNLYKLIFLICSSTSLLLIVAGFFVPPMGIIDGSVLKAVGELFGFAALSQVPMIIKGRNVELKHGNTSLSLGDDD